LTSDDQVIDTPTDNFCTLNSVHNATGASYLSDGNLHFDPNANWRRVPGTFLIPATGKWAFKVTSNNASSARVRIGVADASVVTPTGWTTTGTSTLNISGCYVYADNGTFGENGDGGSAYGAAYQSAADYVEVLVDSDSNTLTFTKNGSSQGTATSSLPNGVLVPLIEAYDNTLTCDFGQGGYTPSDSSYKPLSTVNLPRPRIADGSAYFQTTLYTGNSSDGHEINQSGNSTFTPGLVWIKDRLAANQHHLFDQVRGVYKRLTIRLASEDTQTDQLVSFDSDGFTLDDDAAVLAINRGNNYVAWQWKANGTGSSNTDGSLTSTASANTTSGFSIVSYTGTGANATVGHGLGVTPSLIIVKNRDASDAWQVYHSGVASDAETDYLVLNTTAAVADNVNRWNDTAPTSSVFSLGNAVEVNTNTEDYIAYVFAEVEGFSKFGAYTGNGNANGSFVWCGLRPAWVMIKRTNSTSNWTIFDNQREGYNVDNDRLRANTLDTETTTDYVDILSNGFKLRSSDADVNASSGTYIFMAFAEHPFGGSGVAPVPAR
jgi:hypothetical protein